MQNKHNTTRRDILKAAAVLGAGTVAGAAGGVVHEIASGTGASALAQEWADAIDAQKKASDAAIAADQRADRELNAFGPRPEKPDPADFISAKTKAKYEAEHARLIDELCRITGKVRDLCNAEHAEGKKSPAYRKAAKAHEKALAAWEARKEERATIETRHGVHKAERALSAALDATDKAGRALMNAPIASQADALAVLAAALYFAEMNDDAPVMPDELRRRIAPWLSFPPKAWA